MTFFSVYNSQFAKYLCTYLAPFELNILRTIYCILVSWNQTLTLPSVGIGGKGLAPPRLNVYLRILYDYLHTSTCKNIHIRTYLYIQWDLVYPTLIYLKTLVIQQSFIEQNYLSPLNYVWWTLTYPTPDLSDLLLREQKWLDKSGTTVCTYVCT